VIAKKPNREALCRELLQIRKANAAAFAREDEIKTALGADATENSQIRIDKLGLVKVSAPKEKRCTGAALEIVVETFLRLPEGASARASSSAASWSRRSSGRARTTAASPSSCSLRLLERGHETAPLEIGRPFST
jgi:hypothetical protein